MISVPLEEVIQRLSEDLDQLGFSYIAAEKLDRLQDLLSRHHLTYLVLNISETALYNSNDQRQNTVITTNSDYIMQEILSRTDLCNISPKRDSHSESAPFRNIVSLEKPQKLLYVCLFRNDRSLTGEAKQFLAFIRDYAKN